MSTLRLIAEAAVPVLRDCCLRFVVRCEHMVYFVVDLEDPLPVMHFGYHLWVEAVWVAAQSNEGAGRKVTLDAIQREYDHYYGVGNVHRTFQFTVGGS